MDQFTGDGIQKIEEPQKETQLDTSKYHARVRVMHDPIETIRCWYLKDEDLATESMIDYERHAPLMISIKGFNLKAESAQYVKDEKMEGSLVDQIVTSMPDSKKLKFHLDVSVNAVHPPDKNLLTQNGRISYASQLGDITLTSGENGFTASSENYDNEQKTFILKLMSRTLENTLEKAKKGRFHPTNETGQPRDEIVYDHSLITATDDDLNRDLALEKDRVKWGESRNTKISQFKYIKAYIDEAISKDTK